MDINQRFWNKVDRRGDNDCWLWTGAKWESGYGRIRRGNKMARAHRVAWEITHGPIPVGKFVCHKCDNRSCCNAISHLFLGTQSENLHDMVLKGRSAHQRGEDHGNARLTWPEVRSARAVYATGKVSIRRIAEVLRVPRNTAGSFLRGETWQE
jgi:hypothetical protein